MDAAERQKILDAALDELDESDSDEEADRPKCNLDETVTPCSLSGSGQSPGVPYSLDYLAGIKSKDRNRRQSSAAAAESRCRPIFGPEPPSKQTNKEKAAHQGPLAGLNVADEAGLAASLEGMMKQFTDGLGPDFDESDLNGLGDLQNAEKAMEEMFQKILIGAGDATPKNSSGASDRVAASPPVCVGGDDGDISTKQNAPDSGGEEPDVDESINRLLDGINKASREPPTMPSSADIDPSQFEKFGEEMMSSIMKDFEKFGGSKDSDDAIDGVMKQLLSKDLMYEPMKEVSARFPKWLAENKEDLSEEDYQKYGTQYQFFQRIVHVYETEPDNFPRIQELMQQIQDFGQPPVDIIRSLAPELEFDSDGMPMMMGGGEGGIPGMPQMGNEQCVIS